MAKDFATRAITATLKPLLSQHGFYRRNPKTFVRIRGDLVDVISFQMSQYGSRGFYLHYYCNLLVTPNWQKVLSSYQVGYRIQNIKNGPELKADDEVSATEAMEGVVNLSKEVVLPWFDELIGVKEWLIEYIAKPGKTLNSTEVVSALLLLGHTNRPSWILSDISENAKDPEGDIEAQKAIRKEAKIYADAIDNNTYRNLLSEWRQMAIDMHKIEKAIV